MAEAKSSFFHIAILPFTRAERSIALPSPKSRFRVGFIVMLTVPRGPVGQPTSRECAEQWVASRAGLQIARSLDLVPSRNREACHESVVETCAPSRKPALKEV